MEENAHKTSRFSVKFSLGQVEVELSSDSLNLLTENLNEALRMIDENTGLINKITDNLQLTSKSIVKKVEKDRMLPQALDLSIAEMIRKSGVTTDTDKVLLISYYLFNVKGMETVNSKDIGDAFREARISLPSNVNALLNQLVSTGRMMAAEKKDGKKAFKITRSGEDAAKELLEGRKET